jgi:hypothetical protein
MKDKPKLELKNIQYAAFNSEETHCYSASLYVDGQRVGVVGNQGHGGGDFERPAKDLPPGYFRDLDARIQNTFPRWESEYAPGVTHPATLETVCGELLTEHLQKREFKKQMKKVTFIRADKPGIFQLPAKYEPSDVVILTIQRQLKDVDITILNKLPEEEAFALFQENL